MDLWVDQGKIQKVSRSGQSQAAESKIDANGGLLLPTFIEPHVHLDKVLLGEQLKEASSITEARQSVKEAKKNFTRESVRARAVRVLPWAIQNGVTIVRTHVDVDPVVGLTSVQAILELREKFKQIVDIQIVAFPQEGMIQDPFSAELIEKALDLGCDVIGGMPEAEKSSDESKHHIDKLFSIAKERNLPLDVHCDVLPFGTNIEYYASQSIELGFKERATADHLIALSYYDDNYASKIISMIISASMNVITNPCTMMTSGTLDKPPKGRGLTRVKDLVRSGVNVAYGSDNIIDPYNPFGDFNPLSNGWLLSYGGQLNLSTEIDSIIRMPTYSSSKILGIQRYGIAPGCSADFNIFAEKSTRELLRLHTMPRYVFKRGKNICENVSETHFKIT